MSFEVFFVLLPSVSSVVALEIGLVAFNIVEHVLVLTEELGGIGFQQLNELGYFGATEEQGVLAEEFTCIVECLQLGECLKIANAQLGHVGYGLCSGLCLQQFVELLHLAPGIDAVVVDNSCHLYVCIIKIIPVYFRVLFFFFFGEADFLVVAASSSSAGLTAGVSSAA